VGTVIHYAQRGNGDRNQRWDRIERADLFAQYGALQTQGVSQRQAAKVLDVPRSTLQAWRAYQERLDACPAVVAFFQSVLTEVDLQTCQIRITQGKGHKDRYVLFPLSFRGELAQYMERQHAQGATYLFESNRHRPYSTRRLRQLVKQYATAAGIAKRVYPHLFRHQFITYLTKQGIISPKLQLLSGHATEQSLAVYRELTLADVAEEYEVAMRTFPVR